MLVYLAGPITGMDFDAANDWRSVATKTLAVDGITALSPLRAKEYLREFGVLEDQYHGLSPLSSSRGIITRDRWDCQRADALLVYLLGAEKVSIGTVLELAWADAARVPVVCVIEPEGNPHDHAMVQEVIGFRVASLAEGLRVVRALAAGWA